MSPRFGSKRRTNVLVLFLIVVLGMNVQVLGRPLERIERSAEDILTGVDFLSVFMNTAEERSYDTTQPSDGTQSPHDELTTITIEKTTNFNPTNLGTSTSPSSNEDTIRVTEALQLLETNTEISKSADISQMEFAIKDQGLLDELQEEEGSKVIFLVENPRAIISESKMDDFSIEESEPIIVDSDREKKRETKVKRKSEDLVAIGANPDYIAQQHARTLREGLPPYNQPYHNRNPPSRGRSVSYSTVVQVLPPPQSQQKSWKDEDESNVHPAQEKSNPSLLKPKGEGDYQFEDKNATSSRKTDNHHISVAESKDYIVTRKYSPGDFNDSADKGGGNAPTPEGSKKNFEHTERNWGVPEKNYEVSESEHHKTPTVYGRPEENYEVDEAVSVMTNGRAHGVQRSNQQISSEKPVQIKVGQAPAKPNDNQKIGYVVEGRNYRKYRVEERTSDGFIVGEYGVVSNNDGSLRGVRYTADGTINPRVIYDALMKFLSL